MNLNNREFVVLKLIFFFDLERLLLHLQGQSTLISSSEVIEDLADFGFELVQVLFTAGVNVIGLF
jgi:hypothetical protein